MPDALDHVVLDHVLEVAKIIGLIASGLWVAYSFHKLQKVRAAELENERKVADLRKSRLEEGEIKARLLAQQPRLDIDLGVTETQATAGTSPALCITVTLRNDRDQNILVNFELGPALAVGRSASFADDGTPRLESVHRSGPSYFGSTGVELVPFDDRLLRARQSAKWLSLCLAMIPDCTSFNVRLMTGNLHGKSIGPICRTDLLRNTARRNPPVRPPEGPFTRERNQRTDIRIAVVSARRRTQVVLRSEQSSTYAGRATYSY